MTLSRTPKLVLAAVVSAVAVAPAALAATAHQTPVSHHAKKVTRNALMTAPWTPMIDESRLEPPFTAQPVADYAATLAWLQNRP